MLEKLVGREDELQTLEGLYNSVRPEFLAIYGRRRVGKTMLIRWFFRKISQPTSLSKCVVKHCLLAFVTGPMPDISFVKRSKFCKPHGTNSFEFNRSALKYF